MKKHTIKIHILIPLIVSLITLLLVFIFDIYQSKQKEIEFALQRAMKAVPDVLDMELKNDADMMMAVIKTLNENRDLMLAFRTRDRNKLLTLTGPLFNMLRSSHNITHFYFTDPQRINLLRVHKPEKYGDVINRYTLDRAESTGKTSYGIELGPLGTFTLRVVQPLYDEKGLIGYLELGEEINYLIPKVSKVTGTELYISIKKKYLVRKNWEEGMRMLGRTGDWDMFSDDVIIAQTLREIHKCVSDFFSGKRHIHDMIHMINTSMKDEQTFRSIIAPFADARGTEVGHIVIMLDVTESLAFIKNSIFRESIFFLAIGSILFTILYIYIRKVENHIIDINNELSEDIRKLKKAEEQIKESLADKDVLMKEIHHRVKNNLAVVSSLLGLQSSAVKDEHYRAMFNESINRIKTIASIHDDLYQSKDLSQIIFSDYIKDMTKNIFNSYGLSSRIKLITDIEKITIGIDASIPCGLIVNELITNSMKYAFPEGREGEINVSLLSNDKGEIKLTVGDNGVGMPEGLDFRNTDSLGLTLVNALVRQLQGTIELHREKGIRFQITFMKR